MRRRIKRRRNVNWFPVLGTDQFGNENIRTSFRLWNQDIAVVGSSINTFPLIPDIPADDDVPAAPGSLVNTTLTEYTLIRCVGKVFVGINGTQNDGATVFPKLVAVTCGIYVARANDQDAAGGFNTPVGSATFTELVQNYGPAHTGAIREPWAWRRTWLLASAFAAPTANTTSIGFEGALDFQLSHNIRGGSIQDGPHFDVKMRRRVGNDDRLWFICQATTLDDARDIQDQKWQVNLPSPTAGITDGLTGLIDYRVLGTMRRSRNRSAF